MTPDEKARAYDEALEKARKYHAAAKSINDPSAARYENIFPELRESEDERIRKKCIELIKRVIPSGDSQSQESKEILDCIAYLEKQKEISESKAYEILSKKGFVIIERELYNELCDKAEQEEQKSIEDVVKNITKNKEAATKFLKSAGIMDDNGELAEMYRSEQKPAGWSEEDESCWNLIWDILDGSFTASKEGYKKAAAWFLKNCPKGTKSFNPSWKSNEEDKEMKLKILKYLSTRCSVEQFEEVEEWLNNKLKYVFI